MNQVPFANTGVQLSQMCLGAMMFGSRCDEAESDRILGAALDGGINFIDTAAMYANGGTDPRVPVWLSKYGDGIERLKKFAAGHGVPPAHVATAWVCARPGVTAPIVGVSTLAQTLAAIEGFSFELSRTQADELASFFDTEVKEEAGGKFPELRRALDLGV